MSGGEEMEPFEVIPSIDILDGQVVRLSQGRYDDVTVYDADPAAAAARWAEHAIRRFHVVDLDGARDGARRNEASIRGIVAAMGSVPVQLGGGVRSVADVEAALALGIDRVIMGTVAVRRPEIVCWTSRSKINGCTTSTKVRGRSSSFCTVTQHRAICGAT